MRLRRLVTGHRHHLSVFILIGVVALTLLVLSFLIEVRIIIASPSYGDITSVVSTLWQAILGLTTIGSFALAVYNYRTEVDDSDGPATGFTIRGQNHDINFHLHVENDGRRSNGGPEDEMLKERDETKEVDEGNDDQHSS